MKTIYQQHLSQWSDIQGHLPRLFEAARGNVLEIGVRHGVSTSALLAGVEEHGGHVWSIDITDCGQLYTHRQWTFIQADSQWPENILTQIPAHLDLLFVDGDHSYSGCMNDLLHFGRHAATIMIHDVDCPDTFPGVRRAVEDFLNLDKRNVEWFHESYGLAVIT
jgi:predicted O-methyltransferase YrrM